MAAHIIVTSRERPLSREELTQLKAIAERTLPRLIEQELRCAGLSDRDLEKMAQ
jgi:hypothetical protein